MSYKSSPARDARGIAPAAIIAIIAAALLIAAGAYLARAPKTEPPLDATDAMMEDGAMMEDVDVMTETDDGTEEPAMMDEDDEMLKDDGVTDTVGEMDDGAMTAPDEMMMDDQKERGSGAASLELSGNVLAGSAVTLREFSKGDYDKAIVSDALVVLYFYANWCPICIAETRDALYPAFNELSGENVVGFRVNYNDSDTDDDERALAREFGVAYQHTKVFVKNGSRILKSPESWTMDRYLSEIASAR